MNSTALTEARAAPGKPDSRLVGRPFVEGILTPFGLAGEEEESYLWLLSHPGDSQRPDGAMLSALCEHGLAFRDPDGRWSATPPDIAVEVLSRAREAELHRARQAAGSLMYLYRTEIRHPHDDRIEVVTGTRAVRKCLERIIGCAHWELSCFDKPPHVIGTADISHELAALRRGVTVRTIYERAWLGGRTAELDCLVAAGQQARVLHSVPFKLLVVDRKWAVVPVYRADEIHRAVIVRSSPVLDALQATFERYWSYAAPLNGDEGSNEDVDYTLLTLLASGATDQAIARKLGLGLRTVQRRVSALMGQLGAQTRFQAGLNAARRGLL